MIFLWRRTECKDKFFQRISVMIILKKKCNYLIFEDLQYISFSKTSQKNKSIHGSNYFDLIVIFTNEVWITESKIILLRLRMRDLKTLNWQIWHKIMIQIFCCQKSKSHEVTTSSFLFIWWRYLLRRTIIIIIHAGPKQVKLQHLIKRIWSFFWIFYSFNNKIWTTNPDTAHLHFDYNVYHIWYTWKMHVVKKLKREW